MNRLTRIESILLAAFLSLLIFPLLYLCRSLDNNTLTSWQWVFGDVQLTKIILLLLSATIITVLLSWKIAIEKHPLFTLLSFTGLAILPLWQEPELVLDSGRYFLQAKHLSQYGFISFWNEWGQAINAWTDLPLVPLLYGYMFKLFGESRVVIQTYNTFVFTLTILLTCLTGKILLGTERGFYAALLLLGLPYMLIQVPLMLVDIHAMFFMILALYTFLKAMEKKRGWIFLSALIITLTMLVKFSTWPMLLLLPLIATSGQIDRPKNFIILTVFIFLLALLLFVFVSFNKYQILLQQMELLIHFQRPVMTSWQEHPASRFLFQTHPFITLLAGWALLIAFQKGNHRILIMAIFLLVFFIQISRIRYLIPLMPFFTIVAAYGLSTIRHKETRRFIALITVVSSLIITLMVYLPFLSRTSMSNISNAAAYLETLSFDSIEIQFLDQHKSGGNTALAIPLLDLYSDKTIVAKQYWTSAKIAQSHGKTPLLFTWFQKKPAYYLSAQATDSPLIIISGTPIGDDLYLKIRGAQPSTIKHFNNQTGVFRFKTFVSVFD